MAWMKPPFGWVKLNCHGSCSGKSGSLGGSGVIRVVLGMVKVSFSAHFGVSTNNVAEMRAILEGIHLCKSLNCDNVIIESDSDPKW